jgi:predicted AlkP superfamily phosphohydrolase/phosphomutase
MKSSGRYGLLLIMNLIGWFFASPALAYIGPGAGFAAVSSFLILFITGLIAFLTLLLWPFRAVLLWRKRRKFQKFRQVRRIVVVGLDGLDPVLTTQFMNQGLLPNFQTLKAEGSFRPLQTTCPAISPVAWSTFATGVNPGKHRIFDFFTRNPQNYLPVLSSTEIATSTKQIKIGPLKFPWRRTSVKFLRKSMSFWKILGEMGVFSSILRVPITFPPEKFYGTCLSGMCVPDLRGTQGSFTFLTIQNGHSPDTGVEGTVLLLTLRDNRFETRIPGPPVGGHDVNQPVWLPISGKVDVANNTVFLHVGRHTLQLVQGDYSPWVLLEFKAGLRKRIAGIARFLVTAINPHLQIYMTPIHIDPEHPALPISHPFYFSMSLAKLYGSFATLGLAEDTWALNERILDEGAFLKQAYDIYEERKTHFFDSLKKNQDGLVVSVFDTPDRIQHTFFRYLDADHPANKDKDTEQYHDVIAQLYQKMDALIGEVRSKLGKDEVLLVVSDHGFTTFKWGVNLNTWLWQEGYLVLKDGAEPGHEWFAGVDWSRTRAFAYGLAGIFLNVQGRERDGIVASGEERLALQEELKHKLEAIVDGQNGFQPIRRCILAQEVLKGPYVNDAPDLFVGYQIGYRASWNSAVGKITERVIEENTKSWSGDHSIDPELVPGVFFSNWRLTDETPALGDIAPTILALFGSGRQSFHDGKVLNLAKG